MKKRNLGLTSAVGSYLLWGLLPVYWKQLSAVSAYEILSHRIIWSFFLHAHDSLFHGTDGVVLGRM